MHISNNKPYSSNSFHCAEVSVRRLHTPSFVSSGLPNHVLKCGILSRLDNLTIMQCMQACVRDQLCVSFSVNEGQKVCILNAKRWHRCTKDMFVQEKGYTHYELV